MSLFQCKFEFSGVQSQSLVGVGAAQTRLFSRAGTARAGWEGRVSWSCPSSAPSPPLSCWDPCSDTNSPAKPRPFESHYMKYGGFQQLELGILRSKGRQQRKSSSSGEQ